MKDKRCVRSLQASLKAVQCLRSDVEGGVVGEAWIEAHSGWICMSLQERFDHHCDVVGTCIALGNHRFFAAMLLSAQAGCFILMFGGGWRLQKMDWPRHALDLTPYPSLSQKFCCHLFCRVLLSSFLFWFKILTKNSKWECHLLPCQVCCRTW